MSRVDESAKVLDRLGWFATQAEKFEEGLGRVEQTRTEIEVQGEQRRPVMRLLGRRPGQVQRATRVIAFHRYHGPSSLRPNNCALRPATDIPTSPLLPGRLWTFPLNKYLR